MCVSKPKVPTPTPVIERQAYKNAPSRASLGTEDGERRRRMIAGVATSVQGVTEPASTTKRVRMGGDTSMMPVLSGGGSTGGGGAPAPTSLDTGPTQGAQTGTATGGGQKKMSSPPLGRLPMMIWALQQRRAQQMPQAS